MPGDARCAAVSVASAEPLQSDVAYSFTVDPASAEPMIAGEVLDAGDAGDDDVNDGADGAEESLT